MPPRQTTFYGSARNTGAHHSGQKAGTAPARNPYRSLNSQRRCLFGCRSGRFGEETQRELVTDANELILNGIQKLMQTLLHHFFDGLVLQRLDEMP